MKLLAMAWKFARNHEFDSNMTFKHCAIVTKGSKILGVGYNRYGWSSKQKGKYSKRKQNSCGCSVHAEVDALLKVASRKDIKGSTIYVVRVTQNGKLAMSQPCSMCSEILKEHGVKKAVFSVSCNENTYGILKL